MSSRLRDDVAARPHRRRGRGRPGGRGAGLCRRVARRASATAPAGRLSSHRCGSWRRPEQQARAGSSPAGLRSRHRPAGARHATPRPSHARGRPEAPVTAGEPTPRDRSGHARRARVLASAAPGDLAPRGPRRTAVHSRPAARGRGVAAGGHVDRADLQRLRRRAHRARPRGRRGAARRAGRPGQQSVLIAVSPNQRLLEIVTGSVARRRMLRPRLQARRAVDGGRVRRRRPRRRHRRRPGPARRPRRQRDLTRRLPRRDHGQAPQESPIMTLRS